jgi:hypothetical protein
MNGAWLLPQAIGGSIRRDLRPRKSHVSLTSGIIFSPFELTCPLQADEIQIVVSECPFAHRVRAWQAVGLTASRMARY